MDHLLRESRWDRARGAGRSFPRFHRRQGFRLRQLERLRTLREFRRVGEDIEGVVDGVLDQVAEIAGDDVPSDVGAGDHADQRETEERLDRVHPLRTVLRELVGEVRRFLDLVDQRPGDVEQPGDHLLDVLGGVRGDGERVRGTLAGVAPGGGRDRLVGLRGYRLFDRVLDRLGHLPALYALQIELFRRLLDLFGGLAEDRQELGIRIFGL